jgi:hypothetical protein
MHVLMNAVPDTAYALLAVAGLSYLVPEITRKLDSKRSVRYSLMAFFILFGAFAIIVNAVNREEQDHKQEVQGQKVDLVRDSLSKLLLSLSSKPATLNEAQRREHITEALRDEYILSHDPIDPDILAGTKTPPDAWMNERLTRLGEKWTVRNTPKPEESRTIQELMPEPKKAELTFSLWNERIGDDEAPVLDAVVNPDKDGNYPVAFSVTNTSDTPAENVDIGLSLCISCSFATEPVGFDKPAGSEETARHKSIPLLNPGTRLEKITILVKVPKEARTFIVDFRYSCKTCGKIKPRQRLTLSKPREFTPPRWGNPFGAAHQ